jgi:hypothetical protein
MLYSQAGKSTHVPEEPPVPVVITGAGELPPRSVLDATTAPVLSAGGYPMWAEDQVGHSSAGPGRGEVGDSSWGLPPRTVLYDSGAAVCSVCGHPMNAEGQGDHSTRGGGGGIARQS